MVDAENLSLARVAQQVVVQQVRRLEVVPERFLHHHALPMLVPLLDTVQQVGGVQLIDHLAEQAGRDREIKNEFAGEGLVAKPGKELGQACVRAGIREVAAMVGEIGGKSVPLGIVHIAGAGKRLDPGTHLGAPAFVRLFTAGHANHAERPRHLALGVEVIQRGDQLARGQVATRAEDDDGARLIRLAPILQAGNGKSFWRIHHRKSRVQGGGKMVAGPGIEPGTHGFSIRCSTN